MEDQGMKLIAAALALLPITGVGIGLGMIFSNWLAGISRNPAAADKMGGPGFLGMALTEALGLFALVVSFIILFVV